MAQNENEKRTHISDELDNDFEIEYLNEEENYYTEEDDSEEETSYSEKPSMVMHIIFISAIVILLIVAFTKLYSWNKGSASEYDPNEINTEFDTETEDFYASFTPQNLAEQAADDTTTILLLGNSALTAGEGGIAANLETLIPQSTVYNCGFNQSYISTRNTIFEYKNPEDAYSLYWVANAITTGDYTLLRDNLNKAPIVDSLYESTINQLESIDYSKVDILVIMYDATDYTDKRLVTSFDNPNEKVAYTGSLKSSVEMIQQAYPHIRIIISSPYFIMTQNDNNELASGGETNFGFGYLPDYMIAAKNIATTTLVSYIDNYNGTITTDNYKEYLEADGYTLNSAGQEAIAKRIATFISPNISPNK